MSDLFIVRYQQRTATGLRWRYRCRDHAPEFWKWLRTTSVVDENEDWPWAYWSFSAPIDEALLVELWGEPHADKNDTMDTPAPLPPVPPTEDEMFLSKALNDAITEEIDKEILRAILP